jgi:Domain of unknown function (DUF2610)
MKKFTINCDFGGQMAPFTICLGKPEASHHPLFFQADWLSKTRGGTIPPQVMDAVAKLKTLSEENNVSFEELCVYALGAAQQKQDNEAAAAAENKDNTANNTTDDANKTNDDKNGGTAPAAAG